MIKVFERLWRSCVLYLFIFRPPDGSFISLYLQVVLYVFNRLWSCSPIIRPGLRLGICLVTQNFRLRSVLRGCISPSHTVDCEILRSWLGYLYKNPVLKSGIPTSPDSPVRRIMVWRRKFGCPCSWKKWGSGHGNWRILCVSRDLEEDLWRSFGESFEPGRHLPWYLRGRSSSPSSLWR